jgi:hypothetical protein
MIGNLSADIIAIHRPVSHHLYASVGSVYANKAGGGQHAAAHVNAVHTQALVAMSPREIAIADEENSVDIANKVYCGRTLVGARACRADRRAQLSSGYGNV